MADRLLMLSDDDLGSALGSVGRDLAYPEVDVALLVVRQLEDAADRRRVAAPAGRRGFLERLLPARPVRRAFVLALAFLVLLASAAVAGRLGVPGLKIIFKPGPAPSASPSVSGTAIADRLFLGTRTTLAGASREVSFPVALPGLPGLPSPEVYTSVAPSGGEVSLVYRAGPGLPASPQTRVGLLVIEFDGTVNPEFIRKVVFEGGHVQDVTVSGEPGYWIGGSHQIVLVNRDGEPFQESRRLAGHTLVWQHGAVTLRIEGGFDRARALEIARSFR
jgi:hypothetical protein